MSVSDVKKQYPTKAPAPLLQQPQTSQPSQPVQNGYGRGNPSSNLLDRYREVYNRPEIGNDAAKAALAWDSKGQSTDWAGQAAYGNFLQSVGREPTLQELQQLVPIYQGSYNQGNAAVASLAQQEAQKPQNLQKNAPQYANQVNQVFQTQLGRQATSDEVNHFGGLMSSGNLDAYQLHDFLTGTPEYQNQQDTKFRGGLDTELQNSDLNFFNKAKQGLMSQFMQNGTGQSSALDSALTDLMGQISQQRSQYMAGLSSQQYGGNKQLALDNYGNTQNQFLQNQNYQRQLNQGNYSNAMGRSQQMQDFDLMNQAYNQSQQGRNTLHTGDWINLGLGAANTASQAYGTSQRGGGGQSPWHYFD